MADKTIKFLLVGEDKSATRTLKGVGDAADGAGSKLNGMSVLGAAALAAAGAAIIQFGAASVTAYRDAEKSQRQLEDAYKRFPAVADVNIEKMRELNSAIQAKTGADADDLASSQAVLAQYGLTGQQIADMTPLLDDYAVKTGKDLPAAAEDLGKAMLGQGRALKDVGIDFTDAKSVAANFDQVMGGLRTQVGGFATGEASSAEGQLRKLSTEFGDVQEQVGAKLLPVLVSLGGALLGTIDFVNQNIGVLGALAGAVGVAVVGLVALNVQQGIMAAGGILNFLRAWAAQQAVLNAVMAANPIGLVIVVVAALVAGLIIAYNTSEQFRNVVNGVFQAVGDMGAWLWNNALAPAFRAIVNGFAWIMEGLAGMLRALGQVPGFGWATDAANRLDDMARGARSAAAGIRDIPSRADVQISMNVYGLGALREASALTRQITSFSGSTVGANRSTAISYRADGGPIASGRPYIVGERGPELVIPGASGYVIPSEQTRRLLSPQSGGFSGAGGGYSAADIAKAVREALNGATLQLAGVDYLANATAARISTSIRRGV